jgi:hypothetical protein
MDFEEAARRVYLNRSIAFFGAGFSRDAINIDSKQVASTKSLIEVLSKATGETETLPLDLAAQQYVDQKVEPDIRKLIQSSFSTAHATPYQEKIANLPWSRVYTTNYDNVIEFSRRKAGLAVTSPTAIESPKDYAGFFSVVHLHGFVERLTLSDWDEAHVLTDRQYASDILNESGWLETFKNDASYADAVFFFGYSMSDLDIARLLHQNPSIIEKTFIVVGDKPSRPTQLRTASYGKVIQKSVQDASDAFPSKHDPNLPKPAPFLATLQEPALAPSSSPPTRDDVTAFLIKGDSSTSLITRDLVAGSSEYYVSRDAVNSRADSLGKSPERLLVHSNLGSGKTNGLIELAHYFFIDGWSVLFSNGEHDGFETDVDYLTSIGSERQRKTVIFFENGFYFSSEIRDLLSRFPSISIVATTRTAALQTRIGDLTDAFGEDFEVIDLNRLSDIEIEEIDQILFQNGIWGDRQGSTDAERQSYIRNECHSDLATVLVDVCKSSDIFARVGNELKALDSRPSEVKKSVIATLCLTCAGVKLSVSQICDIVQSDLFKYGATQRDPAILEFMDFARNRVTARSATFAQAVLRDLIPDFTIISVVPSLISRLDRLRSTNSSYKDAVKQLMRFSFIERILSDHQKEEKLISFYEAVRATGVVVAEPQFWLQYAMACMSYQDYENADSHFQTAFGLAGRRKGYDPYQIENQYAKFLLESRTRTSYWSDYFEAFSEAHDIISQQMSTFTEGYYPYRVARLYLDFVEAKNSELSRDQLLRIDHCCGQLLALTENSPKDIKRTTYWRTAREALKATKDFIADVI